jgi:hypothetical protein
VPGYNVEDLDHPAHQPDPAYAEYKKGDPSAWAEDPKTPPYPQGNPPSTPGYDVEDKDHPAHKEMPRVEKMNPMPKGASLREMVEKRADKCIRLARHMLGKTANAMMVEDQALDLMDLPETQLDASLARLAGNPMVGDDLMMDDDLFLEDDLDMPLDDGMDMMIPDDDDFGGLLAKLGELTEQVKALKKGAKTADQNDPKGKTLAPGAKTEEQARAEGAATTNLQQEKTARAMFASMDADRDGFLMAEDWTGNKAMFAAIDVDADGIISADEFVASMAPTATSSCGCGVSPMADDLDPEDAALLAEMEMESAKYAGKKAEDGEEEAPAPKDEEKEEAPAPEETEDKDKAEEASKKATDEAAMFGLQGDPMGLTDINASTEEDKAVLASIFGKTADDDEDEAKEEVEEKEEEEAEGEEASKKAGLTAEQRTAAAKLQRTASQRPQGRKPNPGVRTVGAMTRTAAAGNDVDELSKLWQSDPDVSEVFSR